MILVTTYAVVGSCKGRCKQKPGSSRKSTASPLRDDNLGKPNVTTDSPSSEASNTSAAGASSGAASSSSDSGYDSGYDSSSGSSSETSSKSYDPPTSSGYGSSSRSSYKSTSSGYDSFSSTSPETPSPSLPISIFRGLTNPGTNCYMNAGVQVFAAFCPDKVPEGCLKKFLTKINTEGRPLKESDIEEFRKGLLVRAEQMMYSLKQELSSFSDKKSRDFLQKTNCFEKFDKRIKTTRQKLNSDREEFIQSSLEEAEKMVFTPDQQDALIRAQEMVFSNRHEDADEFIACLNLLDQKRILDNIHWKESSDQNSHSEHVLRVSFDEKPTSIPNLTEMIHSASKASKRVFHTIPSRLYVQLARFRQDRSKINTPVNETMEFTIRPDPDLEKVMRFHLNAFIVHLGESITGGHYIAYVKREGKWYEANDSVITEINLSTATDKSKQAYLLFYTER